MQKCTSTSLRINIQYSYEGELDEDSTDSKLRPGILCNLFRVFSNRALPSRALALNLTRERVRVATLSEASYYQWLWHSCQLIVIQNHHYYIYIYIHTSYKIIF